MDEYRDVHGSTKEMERYFTRIQESDMSDKQKKQIAEFVTALKIGKAGKKVKARRILNYLQFLLKLHMCFLKDFEKITEEEATTFYLNLQEDRIRRQNSMPYAQASKDEFVKALKRFLGWLWGRDTVKYRKALSWMKENYKRSDKQAIILEQAKEIVSQENSPRNRCLFMGLFDSGARIEEMLNVRINDVVSSQDNSFYMLDIRGEKTELAKRIVAVPLATNELNEWLTIHPTGKSDDFLFPIRYDNARKIIRIMSERCLESPLRPHELRHSSATHYIQVFGAENIGGFYYRYGWKYGSKEAETYIKTHLFGGEHGQKKVVQAVGSEIVSNLVQEKKNLKRQLDEVIDGRGIMGILLNLAKQQKQMSEVLEELSGRKFDTVLDSQEYKRIEVSDRGQ